MEKRLNSYMAQFKAQSIAVIEQDNLEEERFSEVHESEEVHDSDNKIVDQSQDRSTQISPNFERPDNQDQSVQTQVSIHKYFCR